MPTPPSADLPPTSAHLTRFLDEHQPADATYWTLTGFRAVGPMAMAFAEWVDEQAARLELDEVFFLARDGAWPQLAFERLSDRPKHYMYASRRMFQFAGIEEFDEYAERVLFETELGSPAIDFFRRFDLPFPDTLEDDLAARLGAADVSVTTYKQLQQITEVFRLHQDVVLDAARAEREHLYEYLTAIGFTKDRRRGLVDIGWLGTTQYCLERLLPDPENVFGLYFGLDRETRLHERNTGFFYDRDVPKHRQRMVAECKEFYELLLSATHASVVSVREAAPGSFEPVFATIGSEEQQRLDIAAQLEQGAILFFDRWMAHRRERGFGPLGPELAGMEVNRLLTAPTDEDLREIGRVPHAFGAGRVHYRPLVPNDSLSLKDIAAITLRPAVASVEAPYWHRGGIARSRWSQRLPQLQGAGAGLLRLAPKAHRARMLGLGVVFEKVVETVKR